MDENETQTTVTTSSAGTATPPAAAAPAAPTAPRVSVPTASMAAIKQRAREKGRAEGAAEAEAKLAKLARFIGLESLDDLDKLDPAQFRAQQAPAAPATAKPAAAPRAVVQRKLQAAEQRFLDEKRRLTRTVNTQQKQLQQAQRQLAAQQAEAELRVAAARAGVLEVDYVLHVLRTELRGKTPEEMATFDEQTYFADLRTRKPFLFGENVVPATTSPTTPKDAPPAAPNEQTSTKPTTVDAKTMDRAQYIETLRKRGLNDPSVGAPS